MIVEQRQKGGRKRGRERGRGQGKEKRREGERKKGRKETHESSLLLVSQERTRKMALSPFLAR